MSWVAKRFSGGWHVGKYPDSDTDWEVTLHHNDFAWTALAVGKGRTHHDWELSWWHRPPAEVFGHYNRMRPAPRWQVGRLTATNHADWRDGHTNGHTGDVASPHRDED